jgi:hypothetical protein
MYNKRGGDIVQNILKKDLFDLNKYIDEQKVLGKKIIYMSGGGPVGLYCGIELMKTGKYSVIISEQRKSYTRKQIFFLQYTTLFNSYENLSQHVKKELEKIGCNIGTPFVTRSDNCNEYANKFDIYNNIDGKLVSINVFKLEELFFSEFILNGGIILKPSSSLDINYNSESIEKKKIDAKLVYMMDNETNKIICSEGCGFFDEPKVEIDLDKIDLIIDSEGGGSKLRKKIPNNERLHLVYDNDPGEFEKLKSISEIEIKNADDILSYGLLLYVDTSKLSVDLINKINVSGSETFGKSLYDPNFVNNTNNLYKKHYIAQNRYRFFASKIDKYEQYFLNFNNLKSPDNFWYLSTMISKNEYNYIQKYLPTSRELLYSQIKSSIKNEYDTEKINYLEIILFSCYNFYGLMENDIKYFDQLLNATTLFVFPVKMFYSISGIAGRHIDNKKPIFSIGDSILGVNYFSGTGVNYGMKYVDELINILQENNDIDICITKYNKVIENSKLLESLSSSIMRFIDFKKINFKSIIQNFFSFDKIDSNIISYNRIYPSTKIPISDVYNIKNITYVFNDIFKQNYGLNNIGENIPFISMNNHELYLKLFEWLKKIFAFNLLNPSDPKHSYNSIYFDNLYKMLENSNDKSFNYKVNLALNGLSTFIESSLSNNVNSNLIKNEDTNNIYFNNNLKELDFGIDEKNFININDIKNNNSELNNKYIIDDDEISTEQIKSVSDPFQEHKNIVTKYITNVFSKSDEGKINTLNLIIEKFTTKINEYIIFKKFKKNSIRFIYKGGNVLRILFQTYKQISSGLSLLIDEYYSNDFTNSDMDFEILVAEEYYNNKELISTIINDLTKMSYVILFDIRIELYKNIDNYIDFFKFTPGIQRNYLENIMTDLNNLYLNKINNINEPNLTFINIVFSGIYLNYKSNRDNSRFDLLIKNDDINLDVNKSIKVAGIPNPYSNKINKNYFYITVNNTIDAFNLVRMKVNFATNYCKQNTQTKIYNKNIGGEFIDVSISKKSKNKNFDDDLVEYTKKDNDGKILLKFESYKIKYFVKELYNIVFNDRMNDKTEKRLNRLLILCLIDAYVKNNFIIDKNFENYIKKTIELIYSKISEIQKENILDINLKPNNKILTQDNDYLKNNNNIFIDGFEYVYNSILTSKYKKDNIESLIKIFDITISTLNNFIKILEFQNNQNIIYNITQLGGVKNIDYKNKYLKYKNKYIKSNK